MPLWRGKLILTNPKCEKGIKNCPCGGERVELVYKARLLCGCEIDWRRGNAIKTSRPFLGNESASRRTSFLDPSLHNPTAPVYTSELRQLLGRERTAFFGASLRRWRRIQATRSAAPEVPHDPTAGSRAAHSWVSGAWCGPSSSQQARRPGLGERPAPAREGETPF